MRLEDLPMPDQIIANAFRELDEARYHAEEALGWMRSDWPADVELDRKQAELFMAIRQAGADIKARVDEAKRSL